MKQFLAISWWMLVIRGAAAMLFGLLALAWPSLTLFVLVVLFSVYTIAVGLLAVLASLRAREQGWWLVLLLGLVSIITGCVAVLYPTITALILVLVIGAGALITGMIDTWIAVRLRKEMRNEWILGTAGVTSILFGALVLFSPGAGALTLVWAIALQSIATGVLFVIFGLRVRDAQPRDTSPSVV